MNAKSPKFYHDRFSGDDLDRVSTKHKATEVRKNKFLEAAEAGLHLKAFP